jgi:hypothetical protein
MDHGVEGRRATGVAEKKGIRSLESSMEEKSKNVNVELISVEVVDSFHNQ